MQFLKSLSLLALVATAAVASPLPVAAIGDALEARVAEPMYNVAKHPTRSAEPAGPDSDTRKIGFKEFDDETRKIGLREVDARQLASLGFEGNTRKIGRRALEDNMRKIGDKRNDFLDAVEEAIEDFIDGHESSSSSSSGVDTNDNTRKIGKL